MAHSTSPTVRTRARRRPPVFMLAALILVGTAVVAAIWLKQAQKVGVVAPDGRIGYVVDDQTCFTGFAPQTNFRMEVPSKQLVDSVATDSAGFRSNERIAHPPDAKCRFLAVGDSFVEGSLVEAHEAFPAQLEVVFQEKGYSVRVDNGGTRKHTIHQQRIATLGRWGLANYDGVILGVVGGNDLVDLERLMRHKCDVGGTVPTAFRDLGTAAVTNNDPARALLAQSFVNFFNDETWWPSLSNERCDEVGREYERVFLKFAQEVKAQQKALLVTIFDSFGCGPKSSWPGQSYTDSFLRTVQNEGVPLVDARSLLNEPGAQLKTDPHPSPEGHRKIAEVIAKELIARGALDPCR